MGANAQTSVPVFTAGQILTAQQQTEINTGIPVFATTTTRDAAFGGTGEKTLAEGQFAYIENIAGSAATQYYDGAAWQTLVGGLVCVKAETAFSAVTSLTADGVFTSSYTNYRIVIRYQTSTSSELAMQLRASAVDTATGYNYQTISADSTTLAGARAASQTSAFVGKDCGAFTSLTTLELSGPQLAEPTVYQAVNTRNSGAYTVPWVVQYFGNQSASTQFDGIKFLVASGTTTGSYTIYGYTKTV